MATFGTLTVDDRGCDYGNKKILYFSSAMMKKISKKATMGYIPTHAVVTYKVKWQGKNTDHTYWIVLPRVFFEREKTQETVENETDRENMEDDRHIIS